MEIFVFPKLNCNKCSIHVSILYSWFSKDFILCFTCASRRFYSPFFWLTDKFGKSGFDTRWRLLYLSSSKSKKNHIIACTKSCLALFWCKTENNPQNNEKSRSENRVIYHIVEGIRTRWKSTWREIVDHFVVH